MEKKEEMEKGERHWVIFDEERKVKNKEKK